MIAHVNGEELYFEKTGSGRPLLMLHGNGEDHTIFREAVAKLSQRYTCYVLDSRGHDRSTRVAPLHYRDMAADVLDFLEAYGLKDVLLYGFSDGGIVALMAAARSSRVGTLVVSGANLTPKGVKADIGLMIRAMALVKKDPKLELMAREPDMDEAELRRITAKTLVLAGSGDLIREKETRRIAAAIPGAQLRILDGEDHGSYIVHSEKIADLILDFDA